VKLLDKRFNGRLVENLQVLRDGLRHNLSKAHVVIRRTREGMVSGARKLIAVPEDTTGLMELLQRDIFETLRAEFIAKCVHLCVQEKVLCVAGRWQYLGAALFADEVNFSSLPVAVVVWTDICLSAAPAIVRELAIVRANSFRSHNGICGLIASLSKQKPWFVFSLVKKLNIELEQSWIVFREVHYVFGVFLNLVNLAFHFGPAVLWSNLQIITTPCVSGD
jgi:hypothetical protein